MKKKLTSNSFDALKMEQQPSGEIANRAMSGGGYFNEYGILYQAADGNTYWTRTLKIRGTVMELHSEIIGTPLIPIIRLQEVICMTRMSLIMVHPIILYHKLIIIH